jgi:hypothetical protein
VSQQLPSSIVMVRPASFGFNPDTSNTILFQREITENSRKEIERRARMEFDMLASRLRSAGVEIYIFDDQEDLATPDAVFPNNWVSFHDDGTVVLYPMFAPSRRPERRRDIIENLQSNGFRVSRIVDLTPHETKGRFLEGMGSVVFVHVQRIAYATVSPRTHREVFRELCEVLSYNPVTFSATNETGQEIKHTDMMMSIGERLAILCADAIADPAERKVVLEGLRASGREVIAIDHKQQLQFAGNVLQLQTKPSGSALAISTAACLALRAEQRQAIEKHSRIVESPLPLFESIGGGSARCMMADVHLPRN